MRISENERSVIGNAVRTHFGEDVRVLLFGSRTDDAKRGGDIDLLVESDLSGREALRAKIAAITDIQLVLGDRKIDIVLRTRSTAHDSSIDPLIVREAERNGIPI